MNKWDVDFIKRDNITSSGISKIEPNKMKFYYNLKKIIFNEINIFNNPKFNSEYGSNPYVYFYEKYNFVNCILIDEFTKLVDRILIELKGV